MLKFSSDLWKMLSKNLNESRNKKSRISCEFDCGKTANNFVSLYVTTKLLPTTANFVPIFVTLIWRKNDLLT